MSDEDDPKDHPIARVPLDLATMLAKYNADAGGMTGHVAEVGVNAVDAIEKATANQFKAPAVERTKQVQTVAWHESLRAAMALGVGGVLFLVALVVASSKLDSPDLLKFLGYAMTAVAGIFGIARLTKPKPPAPPASGSN